MKPAPYPPTEFIAIWADGELDAIVYTDEEARGHIRELRRMGHETSRKAFDSEAEAYAYADKRAGRT